MFQSVGSSRARRDLAIAAGFVVVFYIVGGIFDLAEALEEFADAHEHWELDELILGFALSAIAFAWYSYRRWREYSAELERRIEINQRLVEEMENREQVEQQLRQSQKMEAVGQLTGGVAHDFNNILAVIIGNSEMLGDKLGEDEPGLSAIQRAADRGAELTQRLLAFSRQQPLQPCTIDLADHVTSMTKVIQRTIGGSIEVSVKTDPGLWPAQADPGQVENALLNMAINARDAMPDGGCLTIECSNDHLDAAYAAGRPEVTPGDYAVLSVTDNGTGMPPEVQARVFEPFFTTKDVGKGTGLGLAMIYGFAKQSGGHVSIYSEVGHGTTVRLYLPRAHGVAEQETGQRNTPTPDGEGESILVIEDDADVSQLTTQMLQSLGYRVTGVPEADSARAVIADGPQFDLILSDIILPGGTSGPEFVQEVKREQPDLKVVFMSGFPSEAAKSNGLLDSGSVLLNKPFRKQQLADALRQVLTESA